MAKTLIMGLGSEILMDDGIGIHLVDDLEPVYDLNNLSFQTFLTYSLDIVEHLKDNNNVIIIDGIKTGESEPGSIYHWDCKKAKPTIHLSNFHDIPLIDAVNLCINLGWNMPGTIDVIAVEIEDNITFSTVLSDNLKGNYNVIIEEVKHIIDNILLKVA